MVEQKKRMSLRHLGVGWCSFINTKKKRNVNHKKKKRDPYFERKRRTARSRLRNYPSRKRRVVKQTKQKTNETVCVCKRERERERERRKREREEADFLSGPPNGGSDTKNSREWTNQQQPAGRWVHSQSASEREREEETYWLTFNWRCAYRWPTCRARRDAGEETRQEKSKRWRQKKTKTKHERSGQVTAREREERHSPRRNQPKKIKKKETLISIATAHTKHLFIVDSIIYIKEGTLYFNNQHRYEASDRLFASTVKVDRHWWASLVIFRLFHHLR